MCYEQRLFKSWAKRNAQKREAITPETERAHQDVHAIRPAPEREITRRIEVERKFEEIV